MELKVPSKYKGYLISGFVVKIFDTYKPTIECGTTCTEEQKTVNYNNAIPASKFISIEWFYITNPFTPSVYIPIEYEKNPIGLQANVIEDIRFPEGYYLSGLGGLSFSDGAVGGLACYVAKAIDNGNNYWKASPTDTQTVLIGWGYKTSYWFSSYGMNAASGQWVAYLKTTASSRNATDTTGAYWNIIDLALTPLVVQGLNIEYSGDPIYKKCVLGQGITNKFCPAAKEAWCISHGSDDKKCREGFTTTIDTTGSYQNIIQLIILFIVIIAAATAFSQSAPRQLPKEQHPSLFSRHIQP